MRVLVLGDSTTLGKGIKDQSLRWPLLLPAEVERLSGETCEVLEATFHAANDEAPAYAMEKVAEAQPDTIVLLVTGWGFRLKTVHAKVRRRFGKRAGRFVRWIEEKAEGTGGITVQGKRRQRLYSAGRTLAHRVIGTEALTTPQEAFTIYRNTFALLARQEGTRIITVHYGRPDTMAGRIAGSNPVWVQQLKEDAELATANETFNSLIHPEIRSRHFDQAFYSDYRVRLENPQAGLRIGPDGHRMWALMVAETITGKFLPQPGQHQ